MVKHANASIQALHDVVHTHATLSQVDWTRHFGLESYLAGRAGVPVLAPVHSPYACGTQPAALDRFWSPGEDGDLRLPTCSVCYEAVFAADRERTLRLYEGLVGALETKPVATPGPLPDRTKEAEW